MAQIDPILEAILMECVQECEYAHLEDGKISIDLPQMIYDKIGFKIDFYKTYGSAKIHNEEEERKQIMRRAQADMVDYLEGLARGLPKNPQKFEDLLCGIFGNAWILGIPEGVDVTKLLLKKRRNKKR